MAYKPIITKINAFDATVGTTIYFGWKGPQAFANQLTIKDSETLDIVYQYKTGRQMSLNHTLNLDEGTTSSAVTGTLQNGKLYQATIIVYDKDGVASEVSDPVTFRCFSDPVFEITNQDVLSGIVQMSSLYLNFYYQQNEGELLNEYYVMLFDESMQLLHKSKYYYGSKSEEYLEYRIEGLLNTHSYFVCVNGTTLNGMSITTGNVPFAVKYDKMGVGALINIKDIGNGNISIASNFKILDAKSNPDPPTYINNEEIDLRSSDSYVEFFDGIVVSGNYECKVKLRSQNIGEILTFKNDLDENITLSYNYFDVDYEDYSTRKYYYKLRVIGQYTDLNITTKIFDELDPSQEVIVLIQHINGYYNLKLEIGNDSNSKRLPIQL